MSTTADWITWLLYVVTAMFVTHRIAVSVVMPGRKLFYVFISSLVLALLFGIARGAGFLIICPLLLMLYPGSRPAAWFKGFRPISRERNLGNEIADPMRKSRHMAHNTFALEANSEPFQVLRASRVWASLSMLFLDALSAKLVSKQNAIDFVEIADLSGITAQISIYDLKHPSQGIAEISVGLSSYGFRLAKASDAAGARKSWALTLMLAPRHVSTWAGMAILSVNEQDYEAATSWADKVLAFKPDESSTDPDEIANTQLMRGDGEVETGTVGSNKAMLDQMREIKDICKDAY